MQNFFKKYLKDHRNSEESVYQILADAVATPEFAELYARQIGTHVPPTVDFGLGDHINQLWRDFMSTATGPFTQFATAIVAALTAANAAVNPAHVAAQDAAIAKLQADDVTLTAAEGADAGALQAIQADLTNGLQVLQGVPTSASAPVTPVAAPVVPTGNAA